MEHDSILSDNMTLREALSLPLTKEWELTPDEHDGHLRFWGKAMVHEHGSASILMSYGTAVAWVLHTPAGVRFRIVDRDWSNTTMRHIRSFASLFGIEPTPKRRMISHYACTMDERIR